jgi:hypothetical protein
VLEVGGGDLQGVEHQAGGFAVDLAGGQQTHDLSERDLNGVCVFKGGMEGDITVVADAIGLEFEALFALALVVVAERAAAHGRRPAVGAIGHDVLTLIRQTDHDYLLFCTPPVYPSVCWNQRLSGILRFNPWAAISYGQDLEPQGLSRSSGVFCSCSGMSIEYLEIWGKVK